MDGSDELLKSVTCNWHEYLALDKKFVGNSGNYWINKIYKNHKLVFESIEKSDVDKTTNDLQKEILNYIGLKK